ncbi:MerR family DNA-binding transcriptional regulator, partial [Streptomyces drozdowiczii]
MNRPCLDVGVKDYGRGMRIGELAERAGTTTRTLRYYESRGVLPA